MWMMGYNDGAEFNTPDSFNGRKLRPLMPRPIPSANNTPSLSRINGTDFFALNHHLSMGDQNKRDFNAQPVMVSSRWNPTPEQLRTLEELYRRGTRTPSADQIQHITAQLLRYGKIEGKNVFYWFQNHKARERQKRRRQMETIAEDHIDIFERKDSAGANRTGYEVGQTKNWTVPTNCSTLAEESVSIQAAAKATVMAECRPDGWTQFYEGELQHTTRNVVERNATWQKMQLSLNNPASNTTATPIITTASATIPNTAPMPTALTAAPLMDPKQLLKFHDLNIFIAPPTTMGGGCRSNGYVFNGGAARNHEEFAGDSQTLQLFPLRSGGDEAKEKENEMSAAAVNANLTPYQFFEFLPLKK